MANRTQPIRGTSSNNVPRPTHALSDPHSFNQSNNTAREITNVTVLPFSVVEPPMLRQNKLSSQPTRSARARGSLLLVRDDHSSLARRAAIGYRPATLRHRDAMIRALVTPRV
jgi:hypothetical protein